MEIRLTLNYTTGLEPVQHSYFLAFFSYTLWTLKSEIVIDKKT